MTTRKRKPGESFSHYRRSLKQDGVEQGGKVITMDSALKDAQAKNKVEGTPIGMWRCKCDSFKFKLYEDGVVQCAGCGKVSHDMICGLKTDG